MTYEEIITRAIHKNMLLQEHLERALTPFEPEPQIGWICTRDMWGYICSEAYGEITMAERPDIWLDVREIHYRGLPVHIRDAAGDTEDEDRFFPAVITESIEQGFIDRLSPGARILRGNEILEVLEWLPNSNALTLFAVTLSGHAADEAFSAGVYSAWNRERAKDLYLMYTDPLGVQGTSSMEFRYDSRMRRAVFAGVRASDQQTAELDDDFESADLSILFGEQPNE